MKNTTHTPESEAQIMAGRLNAGWLLIKQEVDPLERARLEDHWITLLHEYEALCDAEQGKVAA